MEPATATRMEMATTREDKKHWRVLVPSWSASGVKRSGKSNISVLSVLCLQLSAPWWKPWRGLRHPLGPRSPLGLPLWPPPNARLLPQTGPAELRGGAKR